LEVSESPGKEKPNIRVNSRLVFDLFRKKSASFAILARSQDARESQEATEPAGGILFFFASLYNPPSIKKQR